MLSAMILVILDWFLVNCGPRVRFESYLKYSVTNWAGASRDREKLLSIAQ